MGNKKSIITIIACVVVVILGYAVTTVTLNYEKNKDVFSDIENNNSNKEVALEEENTIIQKLYSDFFNDPAVEFAIDSSSVGATFSVDELNPRQIAALIYSNVGDLYLKEVKICDTEHEKELISRNVLTSGKDSATPCSIPEAYNYDELMRVSEQLFGKKINIKEGTMEQGYYYYDKLDVVLFNFPRSGYAEAYELQKSYMKDANVFIEAKHNISGVTTVLKFDANKKLVSITR